MELVERGETDTDAARERIEALLGPYVGEQIDAIVLGCTHFPFLRAPIQRLFPDARLFDGREGTALRLKDLLEKGGLLSDAGPGSVEYQSSAGPEAVELMKRLMNSL